MMHSGPITINWRTHVDDLIIENMIITADVTDEVAISIRNRERVTIRNVIIHHPTNGQGINAMNAHHLILENVEVIGYGNERGANPCPRVPGLGGYNCANI